MKRNPFNKYLAFVKGGILETFSYKFAIFGWLIGDIVQVLIICYLWIAIYKFSSTSIINGYTISEMLTYLVTVRIVGNLVMSSDSFWSIGEGIREGTIANSLIRPLSYRGQLLSSSIGTFIGNLIVFFIPLYIIALIILNATLGVPFAIWYNIIFFLIACILGLLIYDAFNVIIGQVSFFTGALFGVGLAKGALFSFLAGTLIPFSFFGEKASKILELLPFSSMSSLPNLIIMGKYTIKETLIGLLIQLGWAIVINLLANITYKQSIKHVVSVGG